MGEAPNLAEFSEFTVRKVKVPSEPEPWYEVHISGSLKYLFRASHAQEASDQPGWLGAIRFPSFEEAVSFGDRIAPTIREAQRARSEASAKVGEVSRMIHQEYQARER